MVVLQVQDIDAGQTVENARGQRREVVVLQVQNAHVKQALEVSGLQRRYPLVHQVQLVGDRAQVGVGHQLTGPVFGQPGQDGVPHLRSAIADAYHLRRYQGHSIRGRAGEALVVSRVVGEAHPHLKSLVLGSGPDDVA